MTNVPPTSLEGESGEKAAKAAKLPEAEAQNSVSPAEEPAAAPAPSVPSGRKGAYVVGKGQTDPVLFSRAVMHSTKTRKSATVHHLQRRLTELGYGEAGADRDGYFSHLTLSALNKWQADNDQPQGQLTPAQFEAIFKGDSNVTVDLDG